MSKSKEVIFNPNRFDEYNLPKTNLRRLTRDVFWILQQMPNYSEEEADRRWDNYVTHIDDEWKAKYAKQDAEREKRSKFENEEYEKCFKETLLPVIGAITHDWGDEIVCPDEEAVKFKVIGAIGCGSFDKDKNKMRAEIAGRWLNNSLEFRIPITPISHHYKDGDKMRTHTRTFWNFWVTYKLR